MDNQTTTTPNTDSRGRANPADMSDRDIAEETLWRMRAITDVLEALGSHPMARAMMPPGILNG